MHSDCSGAILEVKQISKDFGGLRALSNISLHIKVGQICGLIGPNGAGKTTLFNVISGFLKPTNGEIIFHQKNITQLDPFAIAKIGLVRTFQQTNTFPELTVFENVFTATFCSHKHDLWNSILRSKKFKENEKEDKEFAYEIIKYCRMESRTDIKAKNLSYGNQKQLGMAIALAVKPKLLLLDEPAAGLNPSETEQISEIITKIQKHFGVSILVVEHDIKFIMNLCEKISVLSYGEIIAEGSPDEIKSNTKVAEVYIGKSNR